MVSSRALYQTRSQRIVTPVAGSRALLLSPDQVIKITNPRRCSKTGPAHDPSLVLICAAARWVVRCRPVDRVRGPHRSRRDRRGARRERRAARGRAARPGQPAQPRLPARDGRPRRARGGRAGTTSGAGARACTGWPSGSGRRTFRPSPPSPTPRCWRAGFTRVGEFHYLHHDRDGRPLRGPGRDGGRDRRRGGDATGIGLTLLPVFYAQSGFGGLPPTPGQRRFITDLDGYARLLEASRRRRAPPCRTPSSASRPTACARSRPESLAEVLALAPGAPSTSTSPSRPARSRTAWPGRARGRCSGSTITARSTPAGAWSTPPTSTPRAERPDRVPSGAVAGLCPITEANLGDGVFPARAFLDLKGAFGVGSDSNVLIDAAEELRLLEYGQRLIARRRNVLAAPPGRPAGRCSRARCAGSQALGATGVGFEPGRPADIVALATDHISMASRTDDRLLDGWLFAARCGAIVSVWARGRKVVAGGRHVVHEALERRFRTALERIRG